MKPQSPPRKTLCVLKNILFRDITGKIISWAIEKPTVLGFGYKKASMKRTLNKSALWLVFDNTFMVMRRS